MRANFRLAILARCYHGHHVERGHHEQALPPFPTPPTQSTTGFEAAGFDIYPSDAAGFDAVGANASAGNLPIQHGYP